MDKDIKNQYQRPIKMHNMMKRQKNLLGHKIILAHILVKTIDEFKGMNLKMSCSILKENHILAQFQ